MSPEQKRKFNTTFGAVFLTTGLLAWGLTAWFAITPNPKKPAPVINNTVVDMASCRQTLTQLGYQTTLKNKEVTAFEELRSDPKDQLLRASVAATVCRVPMKSFCMGEGCERPGLTLVVSSAETFKALPAQAAAPSAATPAKKP